MFNNLFNMIVRIGDKAGFSGALVAGIGCSACFPALGAIGAALGLGFLSQWESVLVSWVIPLIAVLVMVVNVLGYFSHGQWPRAALGLIGPILILIGAITMSEWYFYPGLGFMLGVSVWDMVSARNKRCEPKNTGGRCEHNEEKTGD